MLPPEELTVVANTGDDIDVWGVHVSPDVDAVPYRLAGIFDEQRGWGIAGETWAALEMMRRLGEPEVAHWHELNAGFSGRRELAPKVLNG